MTESFAWIGPVQIDESKLTGYLLSLDHPHGRAKAAFLLALGFHPRAWKALEQALARQLHRGKLVQEIHSMHGRKLILSGVLTGPAGGSRTITWVWIQRHGESVLRFVTAYPGAS